MHIKSGLHCRSYPRVDDGDFREVLPKIRRHLAGCQECTDFMQRFLYTEPGTNEITVRADQVQRWTHNGPSTSMHRHPFKTFFIGGIRDAIMSAPDGDEQIARILFFEYSILWHNRQLGVKRARVRHGPERRRRAGSDRKPWLREDQEERAY